MFSILESVAFDTGYAGSNGLEPQSWVNGNGTSYIYFGSGEFDGQGSGHDYLGTLYMPSTGSINNCDGGRSHTYCNYRQERTLQATEALQTAEAQTNILSRLRTNYSINFYNIKSRFFHSMPARSPYFGRDGSSPVTWP